MRALHIFATVCWLIAVAMMLINWWMAFPISDSIRYCVVYAIAYTTVSMSMRALDCLDEISIIWDRRVTRRPRV